MTRSKALEPSAGKKMWKRIIVANTNAGGLAAAACRPGRESDLVTWAEAVRASTGGKDIYEHVKRDDATLQHHLSQASDGLPAEGKWRLADLSPPAGETVADLLKKDEPMPGVPGDPSTDNEQWKEKLTAAFMRLAHVLVESPSTFDDPKYAEFLVRVGERIFPYVGSREKAAELFLLAAHMLAPSLAKQVDSRPVTASIPNESNKNSDPPPSPTGDSTLATHQVPDDLLADAQWALEQGGPGGKFADVADRYVAVYRQEIAGTGNDPVKLAARCAAMLRVSKDRIVVKYVGRED
jgi:hypothetical protein